MRKFLGSGWVFLLVLIGGWAFFWWLDDPQGGYLAISNQGSLMPPVVMTLLWPLIALCAFIVANRR